jgi:hypothetical protein
MMIEPTRHEMGVLALPTTSEHTLRHTGGTVSQVDTSPKARDAYFRRLAEMTSLGEAFVGMRTALQSAGIRFAVGGSWASTAFVQPRFTNDVDVLADFIVES